MRARELNHFAVEMQVLNRSKRLLPIFPDCSALPLCV